MHERENEAYRRPYVAPPTAVKVVVRTHGGLGNQIFQVLYARLYASGQRAAMFEIHDARYAHAFARSSELATAPSPPLPIRMISALRLPKVLSRLKVHRDAAKLAGTVYLDGYFQRAEDYAQFDDAALRRELLQLKAELNVAEAPAQGTGVHLRLGDFFTSESALITHLNDRLKRIGAGAHIVTNEEKRLTTPIVAAALENVGARVLPTSNMTPEQVLRTLAGFAHVDGNDSTLLFWASVLSGMECEYSNPGLRALRERFLRVLSHDRTTK